MNPRWSPDEDRALLTYYDRGCQWDGWPEVLPGRNARARRERYSRIMSRPMDMVDDIDRLFHRGYAPSEIATRLGMREETVRKKLVRRWTRDKIQLLDDSTDWPSEGDEHHADGSQEVPGKLG